MLQGRLHYRECCGMWNGAGQPRQGSSGSARTNNGTGAFLWLARATDDSNTFNRGWGSVGFRGVPWCWFFFGGGPWDLGRYTCNVTHISPFSVTEGLIAGSAKALKTGGHMVIYGPFKVRKPRPFLLTTDTTKKLCGYVDVTIGCVVYPQVDGAFTTQSNADFDASLRARDPKWGYRDVSEVKSVAAASGFVFVEQVSSLLLWLPYHPPVLAFTTRPRVSR